MREKSAARMVVSRTLVVDGIRACLVRRDVVDTAVRQRHAKFRGVGRGAGRLEPAPLLVPSSRPTRQRMCGCLRTRVRAQTRACVSACAPACAGRPLRLDGWTDAVFPWWINDLRRPTPSGRGWTRLDGGGVRTGCSAPGGRAEPGRDPTAWRPSARKVAGWRIERLTSEGHETPH